ncbi:anion transporter 2, chloroplastic, partial [Paramuricea clavata]
FFLKALTAAARSGCSTLSKNVERRSSIEERRSKNVVKVYFPDVCNVNKLLLAQAAQHFRRTSNEDRRSKNVDRRTSLKFIFRMYAMLTRGLSLVVAVFLLPFLGRNFLTQALYEVRFDQAKEDYGLADNEVFLDLSRTPRVQCFYHCSMDCRCSSFQMFKDTDCQLLSSSRAEVTLQRMSGYTYYDMIPWQGTSCPIDCCKQNPCLHGGACKPPTDDPTIRFRCLCRKGYGGKRCQYRIGCPGYLDIVTSRANGIYTLVNPNTREPFQVREVICHNEEFSTGSQSVLKSEALSCTSQHNFSIMYLCLKYISNEIFYL